MVFSEEQLRAYMARYGYTPIDTPYIEPAALFLTKAGDQIIERLFTFERGGQQFALRPEFTAAAAHRYIMQACQGVVRWQFNGAIFEDTPSTTPPIYQHASMGGELIGLAGSAADAEIIGMALNGLIDQGLTDWQLVIGHVGLTRHLLQTFALDDRTLRFLLNHRHHLSEGTAGRNYILQRLDQYLMLRSDAPGFIQNTLETQKSLSTMLGYQGRAMGGRTREDIARRLLEKQERAASRSQIYAALEFLEVWTAINADASYALREIAAKIIDNPVAQAMLAQWQTTLNLLQAYGISPEKIIIQPDLARSWDYYTGIVFELKTSRSRLLAGGGRYDELIQLIGGTHSTPAVGFAYYVDEIARVLGKSETAVESIRITGEPATCIHWAQTLRRHGASAVILSADETVNEPVLQVQDAATARFNQDTFSIDEVERVMRIWEQL